jgi:hypothetical protein
VSSGKVLAERPIRHLGLLICVTEALRVTRITCHVRHFGDGLPDAAGMPLRTSDGSLVSPGSTSAGRVWGFGQRIDARRERARKSRSRRTGELLEHLLLDSVDGSSSTGQSAPTRPR